MDRLDEERMRVSLVDNQMLDALKLHSKIIRAPVHIALDITNRCNLQCLHCYNRSGSPAFRGQELTDGEVRRFAYEIKSLKIPSFCFCGGEPLLRFDLVIDVLRILFKGMTTCSLVSNGILLDIEKAKKLKDAGLYQIQISLDGAQASTHERLRGAKGAYDKTIQAIINAKEVGFGKIAIAFSPTKFNCDEFPRVAEMAKELGVNQIRVQPLMLLGNAIPNREDIFPTQKQYRDLVHQITEVRIKFPELGFEWGDPVDHLIRFSSILSEFVPYAEIKSDGNIGVSSYLPIYLGNIKRHSLEEYWEAGLAKAWSIETIKKLASYIVSGSDFYRPDLPIPLVFYDTSVDLDIIDDKLFELTPEALYKLYLERALEHS